MKNFESSYPKLDELVTRVMIDTFPKGVVANAAYLFGETADNELSSLEAASLVWKSGKVKNIAICGEGAVAGYPGFEDWKEKLIKFGIPAEKIIGIHVASEFPPSTHAEALGLVRFAKKEGWKTIYIIAPPLHQLRAFVTTITEVLKENPDLLVYSFPGVAQNWEKRVVHSQGIQEGRREDLVGEELKKMEGYYQKGDLVSGEEVLRYLDRRDD